MRFLLDVNASGYLGAGLAASGHDVARVADRDERMSDDAVLRWALAERRVLITTDRDFEEMIWRQGKPHCGVLRLENLPRSRRQLLLDDVLALCGADLATGAIVIASTGKIRVRRPLVRAG